MHSRPFAVSTLVSGCVGVLALAAVTFTVPGCSSPPPPTPTTAPTQAAPVPTLTPITEESGPPVDVAASRPKETPDPFAKPALRTGGALPPAPSPTVAVVTPSPSASPTGHRGHGGGGHRATPSPAPTPSVPSTPPKPPDYTLAGIFRSSSGPEAVLSGKEGSVIVTQGQKLSDGGYVKNIDPVSRKVVIDKENTDFVLPLEAPKEGQPNALPPPPGK